MKFTKISLATLVALGAFSSVASATPLEEAIKNVDVSGMARYRYDTAKTTDKDAKKGKNSTAQHAFRIKTNFKAAFDDNFFGVLGLRYDSRDASGNNILTNQTSAKSSTADATNADGKFGVYQLYLGYKVGNTTILAGKQELGTFFTNDEVGTGIKFINQDIEGLTLAAIAFDALDYDSYEVDGNLLKTAKNANYKPGNLYGAAAIGSYDPIGFQLWYASLDKYADLLAVELSTNIAVSDDVKIKGKAQYVNSDTDKKAERTLSVTDGNFYAAQLGADFFGANLAAGYIGFKAKDHGTTSFSFEDEGKLIKAGEKLLDSKYVDYTLAKGKGNFWFVKAGYTYDKFFVGGDYVKGDVKTTEKTKYQEYVGRLGYKYSKKLNFTTYYSHVEAKDAAKEKEKFDFYRFQAVYSF